jgi:hypothetical protein
MLPYAANDQIKFLQRNNSDFLKEKERGSRMMQSPSSLASPVSSYQFLQDINKK